MTANEYLESIKLKAQDVIDEIKKNPDGFNLHRVAAKLDFIIMHAQDAKALIAEELTKSKK